MMKKLLVGADVLVVLLVGLAVVAFFVLDPAALVAKKKDELLQSASAKMGRQLTAGDITTKVGTTLSARIVHVRMAGPTPTAKPQLEVGAVDVRFSLWRAILSFGQDLHVERFTVQGLVLRAARDADGRWDFQDIQDRLATDETKEEDSKKGGALEDLRIASMQVIDGRIELDDAMLGRPLAVGDLDIETSDVELGKPLAVKLAAILEDGARKSPINLETRLAVLPKDLSFDPMPNVDVVARLMDVDLGPWGGLVPPDSPAPVQGTLRTDLKLAAKDDLQTFAVDGTVFARGLVLRDAVSPIANKAERLAAPRGSPLDADVAISLDVDRKKPRYELNKLTVTGSGLDLKATAAAHGTSLATLDRADVVARAEDLNKLLAALPPKLGGLPPALKVDGPLAARLVADGTIIDASVNLDSARVRWLDLPGEDDEPVKAADAALFDKPVGKAFNVALHGNKTAQALDVDKLALVLDTAKVGGTLSIPVADGAPLVADVSSGPIELVSLQGLVPPFREAIGRGQKVAGTAELKVKATNAAGKQQADAGLELRALDVNLAATTVRGTGALTLKAAPQGDDVDLVAGANLDGLSVTKKGEDGTLVVNKPAGLPLRLDVNAKKTKTSADVSKLMLAIGKSTINGKGTVSDLDKEEAKLAIDLGSVALAFDDLRATIPGAAGLPSGGRLTGEVKLAGGMSADALVVDAKSVNVVFGTSRIAGDVNVKNLTTPVLDVKLPVVDLAFDEVRTLSASAGDLPAGGRFKGDVQLSGDTSKGQTVKAKVKIASLTAPGTAMNGSIAVENLDKPKFDLTLTASSLNVDELVGDKGGDEAEEEKKPKKKRKNKHGLSKETRALLADVNGKGIINADKAIVKEIPVTNFKGQLVMTRGVARFETLQFDIYGGSMKANGSVLDLPAERTGYDLKLEGKDIDLGVAIAQQTKLGKIFTGRISPDIKVKGRGLAPGDFAISAEGPAELVFKSLAINSLDLLGPIGEAVQKSGKLPKAMRFTNPGNTGTLLDGFKALTVFQGGRLKLQKPVETSSGIGKIVWTGAAGLDAGLDLTANVELSPATVAKMTGGKVKPQEAIPVPLKITGTWDKPKVGGVDVGRLLAGILQALGGAAVDEAKDVAKDVVKDVAQDAKDAAKDAASGKTKDTKKKAKDTANKAADKAKDAAKDAAKDLFGK